MTQASSAAGAERTQTYAIGMGSNRPLAGNLGPRGIVACVFAALDAAPFSLLARSPIIETRPIGPSSRTYANAAALIATGLDPLATLDALQAIERRFRRRRFRRWGARTLDLDLLLWSGGIVRDRRLSIPHPAFRDRAFVLAPLRAIVPRWRDPAGGLTVAHLARRLAKPKPVDRKSRAL